MDENRHRYPRTRLDRGVLLAVLFIALAAAGAATLVSSYLLQPGIVLWLAALPAWVFLRIFRRRRQSGDKRRGPDFDDEARLDLAFAIPFLLWLGSLVGLVAYMCVSEGLLLESAAIVAMTLVFLRLARSDRNSARRKASRILHAKA